MKNILQNLTILASSTLVLSACSGPALQTQRRSDALSPTIQSSPSPEGITLYNQQASPSSAQDLMQDPGEQTVPPSQKEKAMNFVTITTTKGAIKIELFPEKAPGTVTNFTKKATSKYYNNLTFHRVEDWVVQGGDPSGNGTGGGQMPTELSDEPFVEGSVGVARGGDIKVSNDSQFFICTTDCSWLTGQYTNFGKVVEGMDVVKSMAIGDKILGMTATE